MSGIDQLFEGQSERPQPATIDHGYNELSVPAFACWIRMMTIPIWELHLGRKHMAKQLGIPRSTVNKHLRELHEKGYVRLEKHPGRPTHIVILLAPVLVSPNNFLIFV